MDRKLLSGGAYLAGVLVLAGAAATAAPQKPAKKSKETSGTLGSIKAKPAPAKKPAPRKPAATTKRPTTRYTPIKPVVRRTVPEPEPAPPPVVTFYVSPGGKDPYRTIGAALEKAPAGARVLVRTGVYTESLVLQKAVEIAPASPNDAVSIESPRGPAVLMKTEKATVRALTLRVKPGSGFADYAVEVPAGKLRLDDCTVGAGDKACVGVYGGSAATWLRKCQLRGVSRGITVFGRGQATLDECMVVENMLDGASVTEGGELEARDTRFGASGQEGLRLDGGQVTADNCEFSTNARNGVWANTGTLKLTRSRLYENKLNGLWYEGRVEGRSEECELYRNGNAGLVLRGDGEPALVHFRIYENQNEGVVAGARARGTLEACELSRNATYALLVKEDAAPTLKQCRIAGEKPDAVAFLDRAQGLLDGCQLSKTDSSNKTVYVTDSAAPTLRGCKIASGRWGIAIVRAGGRYENCDITGPTRGAGYSVSVFAGKGPTFDNCRISGGKGIGAQFTNKGTARMDRCEIWGQEVALKIEQGADPVVAHCTMRNADYGLNAEGDAKGAVLDCTFRGHKIVGAQITWRSTTLIKNCTMEANALGVRVLNSAQGTLDTCLITANSTDGVLIRARGNPVLKGCTVVRNQRHGVVVSDTGRGTLEGGTLQQNGGRNLSLESGGKPTLRGVTGL